MDACLQLVQRLVRRVILGLVVRCARLRLSQLLLNAVQNLLALHVRRHALALESLRLCFDARRERLQALDLGVQFVHEVEERKVAILGLDEFLDRKPKALSGGQRQRVALGRAIVRQPSAFLFDEPLSNLDAKLRVTTRAELKHLHHRLKTTTIYVTHDQEEAMTLGDRVCVMDIGLVQQIDTPMNIYNYPVNRFVAGFMGMPPMNFIEGKLNQDGEAVFFEGEGLAIRLTDVVAGRVMGHIGKDVILGLRPEAMRLRKEPGYGEGDNQTFEAKVDVVEPLGKEMDAYLETSKGKRIIARIPAEELEHDINVTMHVSASRLHIFEPGAHGLNISLPQEQIAAATVG